MILSKLYLVYIETPSTMVIPDVWHYTGYTLIVEWSLDTGGHKEAVYIV
jgi:hypothetical protein